MLAATDPGCPEHKLIPATVAASALLSHGWCSSSQQFLEVHMIRQLSLRLLCVTLLTVFSAPLVMAQNESGTIMGAVTDPTGAVVPGAAVTIVDLGTNTTRTAKTGPNGEHTFSTCLLYTSPSPR